MDELPLPELSELLELDEELLELPVPEPLELLEPFAEAELLEELLEELPLLLPEELLLLF